MPFSTSFVLVVLGECYHWIFRAGRRFSTPSELGEGIISQSIATTSQKIGIMTSKGIGENGDYDERGVNNHEI